jgi:hypothetical protein
MQKPLDPRTRRIIPKKLAWLLMSQKYVIDGE